MLPPRAYIFLGLNGGRILSIIAMLLVFASSIFVLVNDVRAVNLFMKDANDVDMTDCDYIENSTVPNQPAGVFWAVVNRLLIIFQIIVLILSEVGWPMTFFDHFFPVLGSNFGVGPLGIFQCLIGATILSHHVDDFTLVAAFFLFALGCLNMLLGLIFREKSKAKRSILSWREEAKGVLPSTRDLRPQFTRPKSGFMASVFNRGSAGADDDEEKRSSADYKGFGFGRKGERESGYRGFILQMPKESRPAYAPAHHTVSSRAGSPEPRFKSSNTAI